MQLRRVVNFLTSDKIIHTLCNHAKSANMDSLILHHTKVTSDHLTPEIKLHLITHDCPLWKGSLDECPFQDPYWGFYWPGGQVITRFLLDNPHKIHGRRVIDIGSGCGAAAIASALCGATTATANDTDNVAIHAVRLNAALNKATVNTLSKNVLYTTCDKWNTILMADLFYDSEFTASLVPWIKSLHSHGKLLFLSDPGRPYFKQHIIPMDGLQLLAEYELPQNCMEENRGLSTGSVWSFV